MMIMARQLRLFCWIGVKVQWKKSHRLSGAIPKNRSLRAALAGKNLIPLAAVFFPVKLDRIGQVSVADKYIDPPAGVKL